MAQILAFGALCFAPDRLSPGRLRTLLLVGAVLVAAYALRDADYTLLAGELALGAAGWRMAGADGPEAGKGRP